MANDEALVRPRHRGEAVLFALLVPGMGHLYVGQPRTAVRALLFVLVVWLTAITVTVGTEGRARAIYLPLARAGELR